MTGRFRGLTARLSGNRRGSRGRRGARDKKALLVLLAVLILPVSVVWGSLYLVFGSPVGIIPFIYFAVSVASLVVFARTEASVPSSSCSSSTSC